MALAWVQVLGVVLAAVPVQVPAAVPDRAVAQVPVPIPVLASLLVPVPVPVQVPGQVQVPVLASLLIPVQVPGQVLAPAVAPAPAAGKILARAKVCRQAQAQAQLLSPVLAVAAPPVGGRPKRPPAALAGRRRHQRLLDSGHSAPNRRKSAVGQGRPETGLRKRGSR